MLLDTIKERLKQDFQPEIVEVLDESHKHAGHAGYGEYSHLHIRISANAFAGKSRVERERLVRSSVSGAAGRDIHAMRFEFV
jgi:BolA family transcriptional regulator, general stress-responsive regulator